MENVNLVFSCIYKIVSAKIYQSSLKFFLFNDCQPKTIGFRVSTSNLGHNYLGLWPKLLVETRKPIVLG